MPTPRQIDHNKEASLTKDAFQLLAQMQRKYGPLPTLLATKADFTVNTAKRHVLLKKAWRTAAKLDDKANLVLISSSLAELCLEDLKDLAEGDQWLAKLKSALELFDDKRERAEWSRLSKLSRRLKAKLAEAA